jgi:predicted ribosomally synthesized peptide with nif11-like leader
MSFRNARAFLELVREDEQLRRQVAMIASAPDLEPLARLAEGRGLPCGADDLRKAWRKTYMLRQVVAQVKGS